MYEKILVVDDEANIVDIIKFNLEKQNYRVVTAYDGYEAMDQFDKEKPDLVILDVMMPGMDGFEVCRRIRSISNVPIILVTARTEEIDTVLGLEMGADEYVAKPFSLRELMARVKASLRRYSTPAKQPETEGDPYQTASFKLDINRFTATYDGKTVDLTHRETEILKLLMNKKGQIFSREEILKNVWGYESLGDERTVDVTIRRLREKIEPDSSAPTFLLTKRGVGYYFSDKT